MTSRRPVKLKVESEVWAGLVTELVLVRFGKETNVTFLLLKLLLLMTWVMRRDIAFRAAFTDAE